ncbi:YcaO-like family protein [Streptomyces wuyuanensis]|uniref:YcaO-like family protein n=1 Tax=Streptomyces wuyuanensis TaxID=1196353 RepID=UPI0037B717D3
MASSGPATTGQRTADADAAAAATHDGLRLVRRVTRDRPRVPTVPSCVSYSAHLSAHPDLAQAAVDTVTGGAALGDHARARAAAVGEAVERYCGNLVPDTLPVAPWSRLVRDGRDAVDPREFALYSPAQHARRGFPFVAMSPELPIGWVAGHDLADARQVLVPASLTYVNYFRGAHRSEPPTNYPLLAGTAAGATLEEARLAALREVLERDAVTLWWLSGAPATPLYPEARPTRADAAGALPAAAGATCSPADLAAEADTSPVAPARTGPLAEALREAASAGLCVTLLSIPSTFDVVVAGAFIEDPVRRLVAFGSACRATADEAAAKALTEAVGTHETCLELLDHEGDFWNAVRRGRAGRGPYRPHREDRAYLDDFRSDWRDVNDVRLHLQVYLDPRTQDSRLDRLRFPGTARYPRTVADASGPAALDDHVRMLAEQGLRVVSVDLTAPEVRAAGFHVVRVLVPGLTCNAPAAFPFLGGRRLYHEPVARGWLPRPPREADLVLAPLPFS